MDQLVQSPTWIQRKAARGLDILWVPRPNFQGGTTQWKRDDAPRALQKPLLSPIEPANDDTRFGSSGGAAPAASTGGITGIGLAAIGFFWVSGGSYGNEALVLGGPPGTLFLAIIVLGLSYGVPLAVITAELGTGWPVAGGMGQWVEIAMGEAWGAHNAWWIWVCYVFDGAIYPVIAGQYLAHYTEVTQFQQSLYATMIVFAMTLVKLGGRDILESLSTFLAILTLMPSLIYWGAALHHGGVDVEYLTSLTDPCTDLGTEALCHSPNASSCTWGGHESLLGGSQAHPLDDASGSGFQPLVDDDGNSCGGLNLSLLLSYVMWLYSGFISLGSLAGELEDPVSAYWTALLILVPVVVVLNCMPLIVSMTLDHDRNHFSPGYFQVLATSVTGQWMKTVYFLGSQVSLYGLYNSTVITAECTIPPFFEKYLYEPPRATDRGMRAFCLRGKGEEEPGFFYVVLNMVVCAVLVWAPYQFLIEVTMLLMVVMTYPFLFSFVWLRVTQPDVPRAFKVPGGTFAAILWTLPPALLGTAYVYICVFIEVDHSFGIPYFNVLCTAATVGIGVFVHLCAWVCGCTGVKSTRDDGVQGLL